MPENLMNSAQKANSKEFNDHYDRIFSGYPMCFGYMSEQAVGKCGVCDVKIFLKCLDDWGVVDGK